MNSIVNGQAFLDERASVAMAKTDPAGLRTSDLNKGGKTLLKRLASGKLSSPFKTRETYQKGWAGLESPSKAQSAIDLLIEYHHLGEEEITTGGRPTTHYHWVQAEVL